jgi:hypothetical protein
VGKKVSNKGKGQHAIYKAQSKFSINKKRKIARHIKQYPEDKQAADVLVNAKSGFIWSRKTPYSRTWKRSKELMAYAHLLRKLGYSGDQIRGECFFRAKKAIPVGDTRETS